MTIYDSESKVDNDKRYMMSNQVRSDELHTKEAGAGDEEKFDNAAQSYYDCGARSDQNEPSLDDDDGSPLSSLPSSPIQSSLQEVSRL